MSNIFVISDTHIGHSNILKFTGEDGKYFRGDKFKSSEEMDEYIIEKWNSVVTPQDKVYHLGDVYFGAQKNADNVLRRLNGHKRLVIGNHDRGTDTVLLKYFDKITLWRLFKEHNVILSHVPLHPDQIHKVEYNVHGHIHEKSMNDKRYINVSCERVDYTPVSIEEVLKVKG